MATVTFNNNFDVTITQQGKPVPVPTTPTITQNCNNSVLTRGTPPANITWYWQSTANGYSMADDSLTHKVTSTGTYYLRARHSSGSWSAARSVYVEVVTPPLVQVAASPLQQFFRELLYNLQPVVLPPINGNLRALLAVC
jgi:hypothetical protein